MHATDGPSGTTYFHHGDFSGDVMFRFEAGVMDFGAVDDTTGVCPVEVRIPMADLIELVAAMKRSEMISRLEQMEAGEVIGLVC